MYFHRKAYRQLKYSNKSFYLRRPSFPYVSTCPPRVGISPIGLVTAQKPNERSWSHFTNFPYGVHTFLSVFRVEILKSIHFHFRELKFVWNTTLGHGQISYRKWWSGEENDAKLRIWAPKFYIFAHFLVI